MKSILREPLVHFLLIGALMFAAYAWNQGRDSTEPRDRIVVSAGRIQQLSSLFQKTWQRPPTQAELERLVDDFVLEEVYYRQATEMGIDRDDTIIRRRLRQKLEFLTDDAAALVSATDQQLGDYLAAHPEKFRESPTYTFRQVYFNPDKHGDQSGAWFAEQIKRLGDGDEDVGDPSLLPESIDALGRRAVDATFGIGFSAELDKLQPGRWHGPVSSGLGLHCIFLNRRTEGRLPELEQIRAIVQREWANERRLATRDAMNQELLRSYDVVVEWPKRQEEEEAVVDAKSVADGADS